MEESKFYLPVGITHNGNSITDVAIANTGAEAEKIYTDKPTKSKLYTWFGKVISASIDNIGGVPIASSFLAQKDKDEIPDIIKSIPAVDVGSLLVQIQRECWEDEIKDQRISCANCGEKLIADIELNKIEIPKRDDIDNIPEFTEVDLGKTYEIGEQIEQLKEYEGYKFNRIKFRIITLGDTIKHQGVAKDDVLFWSRLAYDTMISLYFEDSDGSITEVPTGWINKRGMKLFNTDFNTKTLKSIRKQLQTNLPSAKYYYEDKCPSCDEETPFFASTGGFFMV